MVAVCFESCRARHRTRCCPRTGRWCPLGRVCAPGWSDCSGGERTRCPLRCARGGSRCDVRRATRADDGTRHRGPLRCSPAGVHGAMCDDALELALGSGRKSRRYPAMHIQIRTYVQRRRSCDVAAVARRRRESPRNRNRQVCTLVDTAGSCRAGNRSERDALQPAPHDISTGRARP